MLMPKGRRVQRPRGARPRAHPGTVIALLAGIACGIRDLQTGQDMTTALLLGGAATISAVLSAAGAVPRAIALALGVPLVYFVASLLGITIPYPPAPHWIVTIALLVPALAGALLGLAVRRLIPTPGGRRRVRS
ncbi:MAG TPA: hypothetical protein VF037_05865 [Gemmatimonadales bacterium]